MNALSELKPGQGGRTKPHRLGRGRGCGKGGTSTKGHKGQKARSGYKPPKGFEGGQMPLIRRLPKFGFTNRRFKVRYKIFNLSLLTRLGDDQINPDTLYRKGLIPKGALVKILGQGQVEKKWKVSVHGLSASARKKIEAAGGEISLLKSAFSKKDPGSVPGPEKKDEAQNKKPPLPQKK